MSATTRLIRSGVTRFGTSSSAVWVVMWLTRMAPCTSSITLSRDFGEVGEQFRVAAIVVAREVERFLADRPRANGAGDAVERQAHGGRDRVIRYATALRRRLAGGHGNAGCVDVEESDRGQISARLRGGDRRRGIVQPELFQRFLMRRARADEKKREVAFRDATAQGRLPPAP